MNVMDDQLNKLRHFLEGCLDNTFNTRTRAYGRHEVLMDDVFDLILLVVNCCLELTTFGVEVSKLTELVLKDSVDTGIWFGI